MEITSIKVLGMGCKTCQMQFANVQEAVKTLGLTVVPEHITDLKEVIAYGVMTMPALVVNERVVSAGRLLKPAEVVRLLADAGA